MEIHEQILFYLYKFRGDSEYHDLFDFFDQKDYEVIWDRTNSLHNEKSLEIQPETSIGWDVPVKPKHELFARITKSGIERVKTEMINQKQKDISDKKRFRITTGISIAFLVAAMYGIYQTDKTNKLEKDVIEITTKTDSLTKVTQGLVNDLEGKERELIRLRPMDTLKNR